MTERRSLYHWFGTVAAFRYPAGVDLDAMAPERPGLRGPETAPDTEVDVEYHVDRAGSSWGVDATSGFARTGSLSDVVAGAWRDLELGVAAHSEDPIFVHAGAVAIGGRGIVLPGRSGAGKTTLVLALLEAGATYYSDEYALIDRVGRLLPYPRDLHVRSVPTRRGEPVSASEVASAVGASPVGVDLILFSQYEEGGSWAPVTCNRGETALRLMENAVGARTRTRPVMDSLGQLAGGAEAFIGSRGEAQQVVDWLLEEVPMSH